MSEIRSKTARAAAPGGAAGGGPRPGLALLDATIVNVALPHIQRALGFSGSGLEWVVNAYALAFGGLLLLGGRAGDRLGRRKMFIAGLLLFSAASLAGGFASSQAFLLTARAVQGAGGALVAPRVLAESPRRHGRFDLPGAITGTAGVTALVYGLISAATSPDGVSHWGDAKVIASLAAAAVLLAAFAVIETRS